MSEYRFTPQAADDLFFLWSHIAEGSPEAANRVEEAVYSACAFIAENPNVGRIREDLTVLPVRFWLVQPFRNCWIVYEPTPKPLQIIRILHPARNIAALLS